MNPLQSSGPTLSAGIDAAPRDTLADRAYRAVRLAIINHELVPDHYYSEAWLAGLLGISRTPTHAALIQLELEGLVEIVAQRGFRLRQIAQAELDEFYDIRVMLESNALRRLAERHDGAPIAALRQIVERQHAAVDDVIAFLDLDEGFHHALAEAAGLHRTAALIHSLRGMLWLGIARRPASSRRHVAGEHAAIVEALAGGDGEGAVAALETHLRTSQERTRVTE